MSRLRLLVVALALFAVSRAASGDEARARLHFETGKLLYRQGDYAAAAKQFRAGYDELPRPEFLLNAGVCYAKVHDDAAAKETLARYLEVADPADPGRTRARALLDELASSPADRAQPAQPALGAAQPSPPSMANALPKPDVPRAHGWRRWWWLAPLSAVVVVGVALGIYFGVTADDCHPPLCIHYR